MLIDPTQLQPDGSQLHRLVSSHFPPIALFETVADPAELDIAFEIEAMTNDRLRDDVGDLSLIPAKDRIVGPGATAVMAAFTHIGMPSRFTEGGYGVYYGSPELATAVAETVYHKEIFLAKTQEPDTEVTMRQYINQVALTLHDVRECEELHDPNSYEVSQAFAKALRDKGSNGLVYRSVRRCGGECVAAFRPTALTHVVQGQHIRYVWSGHQQKIIKCLWVSELV